MIVKRYAFSIFIKNIMILFVYLSDSFFGVGLKEELQRTNLELDSYKEKIKENQEKIKLNKQLPYLVGNIVEVCSFISWFSHNYFGSECLRHK